MPAVQSKVQRLWNRAAVVMVLIALVIMMIPLYWIGSTAFKDRADATTVPPTVFFRPEITAFIKLFTSRVEKRGAPDKEAYAKAPWWERQVMEGGERFIRDDKGNIVRTIEVGAEICGHTFVDGMIFVLRGMEQPNEDWRIARFDPREDKPEVEDLGIVPFASRSLTYDGNFFWSNHRAANEIIAFSLPK